jgi:hypothetical protein
MEIPFLIVNDLLGESNQISSKPRRTFYVCRLVISVGMCVRRIALRTRLPASCGRVAGALRFAEAPECRLTSLRWSRKDNTVARLTQAAMRTS